MNTLELPEAKSTASRESVTIVINEDGSVTFLNDASLAELSEHGKARTCRASHIEPCSASLRCAFHVLRSVFGESSAVAAFTRKWPVAWRVNLTLSGGPIYGRFVNRAAAIASEEQWLVGNNFGTSQQGTK